MRILISATLILAGCAATLPSQPYMEENMLPLAADLTKVSAAAEATLRYGAPLASDSDDEFLATSVAHDPGLLTPFTPYKIQVMRQAGHVAVLVCSADGRVALLEDAGCTAAMDRHRWKNQPLTPCAFTVDLQQLCRVPPE
jgi:hypothetical protein